MPSRMTGTRHARLAKSLAALALWAFVPAAGAAGQTRDEPYGFARGRVTFGGEIAGSIAPRDDEAFFNYTDYERDTLRMARVRLFGQWRIAQPASVVVELRSENVDTPEFAALYLRWRPLASREFDIQIGRIPPVVGAFARRAYGRDNLVVGLPLAYQYLTSLRPDALPGTVDDLLRMRGRGWRPAYPIGSQSIATGVPLVSATRWDTGIEARWKTGWLETAAAFTRGAPAVPVVRETNGGRQWSGRAAVNLPMGMTIGVSGARGEWIEDDVLAYVPENRREQSTQSLVGADVEYGIGHWLVRAEVLRSVFRMPIVAEPSETTLAAWSGFVEARYRWHPRWQVAGRAERLDFGAVVGSSGVPTPWDAPVTRLESVVGFRATRAIELRAGWQYNWRDAGRVHERGSPAVQILYWF
jgi:hypothetical protein